MTVSRSTETEKFAERAEVGNSNHISMTSAGKINFPAVWQTRVFAIFTKILIRDILIIDRADFCLSQCLCASIHLRDKPFARTIYGQSAFKFVRSKLEPISQIGVARVARSLAMRHCLPRSGRFHFWETE